MILLCALPAYPIVTFFSSILIGVFFITASRNTSNASSGTRAADADEAAEAAWSRAIFSASRTGMRLLRAFALPFK
jgi:hypothetical protein